MRVADRDHELAHAQRGGVAEHGGREVVRLGAQHREVRERVAADHAKADLASIDERGAPAATRAGHDVGGGQQEAIRREHHRAAAADRHATAPRVAEQPEIGDARSEASPRPP